MGRAIGTLTAPVAATRPTLPNWSEAFKGCSSGAELRVGTGSILNETRATLRGPARPFLATAGILCATNNSCARAESILFS